MPAADPHRRDPFLRATLGRRAVERIQAHGPRGEDRVLQVAREDLERKGQRPQHHATPPGPAPRHLERPEDERDARQGVRHAGVDEVGPGEAPQAEDRRPGQRPGRPDVATQPAVGPQARQPDREHRVEVQRLPGRQPGVEQVLQRVQVAGLALAVQRQAAVEVGAPPREAAGPQLAGEEGAVGVVDLGDVEVEQAPGAGRRRRGRRPPGRRSRPAAPRRRHDPTDDAHGTRGRRLADPASDLATHPPSPDAPRARSTQETASAIASSCTTERFCSLARYSRPFLTWMWSQGRTSSTGRSRWL